MKNPRHSGNRRARRMLSFGPEILESRALLSTTTATETFTGPSLSDLIQQARGGTNTAPAAISRIEQALQTQLTSGPLADLKAGKVSSNGFVTEVQNLEASYEQNLDSQLSPEFPNVNEILKLQGQKVVADVIALNQEASVGLISSATLATDARVAINSLTTGPIDPLNPSLSAYTSATQTFETDLNTIASSLNSSPSSASASASASASLTPGQASATALAETQAFLANMHAGLQVGHPNVSSQVDAAVTTLQSAESGLAQDTAASAQSALKSAVSTFDTAMLGSGGVFDPAGPVARAIARGAFAPSTTQPQSNAALGSLSGTATQGKATLSATLTGSGGGSALAGQTVSFTLDGAFAGIATTDSQGVATLTGVPTSNSVGTDTGGVVAHFAGNSAYRSASATGDLTVTS